MNACFACMSSVEVSFIRDVPTPVLYTRCVHAWWTRKSTSERSVPSPFTLSNIKHFVEEHAIRGCENSRYFTSLTPSLITTFFSGIVFWLSTLLTKIWSYYQTIHLSFLIFIVWNGRGDKCVKFLLKSFDPRCSDNISCWSKNFDFCIIRRPKDVYGQRSICKRLYRSHTLRQ